MTSDRIVIARLDGVAFRYFGQRAPQGDVREEAIRELREIATLTSPPATPRLRTDLLGQVAGLLTGSAPSSDPLHHEVAVKLLFAAGADHAEAERSIPIGERGRRSRSRLGFRSFVSEGPVRE